MQKVRIDAFDDVGYSTLVAYDSWRVAMLNYIEELEMKHLTHFQKHDLTDEVFVLLQGECYLFLAHEEKGVISDVECIKMQKNTLYTVKKGIYHTHTLSEDAKVLIVENDDTSDDNSPKVPISLAIKEEMRKQYEKLHLGF